MIRQAARLRSGRDQSADTELPRLTHSDERAKPYLERCMSALACLLEPPRDKLVSLEREGLEQWSQQQLAALHQELGMQLIAQGARRVEELGFPVDIREGFVTEFSRIEKELAQKPLSYFTFANYRFKADMRILCFRRTPAGMYDLEVSGIPKSMLLGQGVGCALRLARVIATAGGFKPFFTQHISPHRMKLFSPVERELFLRRTAALLLQRTEIRGLMSTAWYNDPAVAKISPQLSYLREGWEQWGEGVFRIGTSAEVTESAIAYSFERRRLVDAGTYVPAAYLGVALRSQILSFS